MSGGTHEPQVADHCPRITAAVTLHGLRRPICGDQRQGASINSNIRNCQNELNNYQSFLQHLTVSRVEPALKLYDRSLQLRPFYERNIHIKNYDLSECNSPLHLRKVNVNTVTLHCIYNRHMLKYITFATISADTILSVVKATCITCEVNFCLNARLANRLQTKINIRTYIKFKTDIVGFSKFKLLLSVSSGNSSGSKCICICSFFRTSQKRCFL